MNILISGGGTGGHIFPAIAIANALQEKYPETGILFVGAQGRIEMEKVPQAGYPIEALPVMGFPRKISVKTATFFWYLLKSMFKARRIVKRFKPDAVVGVGGYASGPVGRVAAKQGIPLLLQEQNSYAGITNKLLAKYAKKICVAYDNMEVYFPAEKIIKTGNPVRRDLINLQVDKNVAAANFGMQQPFKKVILIVGGSGGAKQINESVLKNMDAIAKQPEVAVLWQTGKHYFDEARKQSERAGLPNLFAFDFITRMDYAYGLADLVISRSGAGTISELGVVGKPAIFVPSPNVAEDHQTKNAMALVKQNAAEIVEDKEAPDKLIIKALDVVSNDDKLQSMAANIRRFGIKNASEVIADEVIQLIY